MITFLVLAVAFFPGLPSIKTTGQYVFASEVIELTDDSRKEEFTGGDNPRKLSVLVYYPQSTNLKNHTSPLVVFSHGAMGYQKSNISLFEELASHGYVVASVDHTYQALFTKIDGRTISIDKTYFNEVNSENSHKDINQSLKYFNKWMDLRTTDLSFVIDYFLRESSKPNNSFYSLVNDTMVGAAGHSLGGSAALCLARQRSDVNAVVALESPFMCDMTGVDGDQFTWNTEPYEAAIMNIYSNTGYPKLVENDHKYVQNKNYLRNDGKIEYYHVTGSNHFTLTDLSLLSPLISIFLGGSYETPGAESLKLINNKSVAFFDKHLNIGQ